MGAMQKVKTAVSDCLRTSGEQHSAPSGQTRFFRFPSFHITDLLKFQHSVRTMDGENEEREETSPSEQEVSSVLCDSLHSSIHLQENSAMMRAALCSQVCKLYRFQTEDGGFLLVREQMSESPLCFSLPQQLLCALTRELTHRIQEVRELGDLSPQWDAVRLDVTEQCQELISCYQETLEELHTLSESSCFKSSSRKSEQNLQFVPTNLHSQRMEVISPPSPGVWYEVVTFGAPADHHQAFKHGGLKRLLSKHTHRSSYSQEEVHRAWEVLRGVARLQPAVFGQSEEVLFVSLQEDAVRLQEALEGLTRQTEGLVHALKDELVKSALLEARCSGSAPTQRLQGNGTHSDQEGQRDEAYDEEEWDLAWMNVTKSLNCIVVLVDRLQSRPTLMTSLESRGDQSAPNTASSSISWQEQLLPLVVTLRECVREAVDKARIAMTFVILQRAATMMLDGGPTPIMRRRHAVFSQALSALVCGLTLKLYGRLEDPQFLQQLHRVGVLAQFEGLLSTYGDEVGMLEDMEVGVADLSNVAFRITESATEQPNDLLPTLSGSWGSYIVDVPLPPENFGSLPLELKDGRLIAVETVLFNIGINQQQSLAERFGDSSMQDRLNQQSCRRLTAFCQTLRQRFPDSARVQSLPDLLSSLHRSVESKKRKNVELLWTAAMICRAVDGVRLTSCKSAKDRTAMSVTLEQCTLLRERHALDQQHFGTALDCMRRDGCRMDNVQKNVGNRKFAFSGVQLLTFPKLYRPPDGSYG